MPTERKRWIDNLKLIAAGGGIFRSLRKSIR